MNPPPSRSTIAVAGTRVCAESVSIPRSCDRRRHTVDVLELFPETARIEKGALTLGGVAADDLAEEFGTPLVVYCEQTLLTQAGAYTSV